MQQKESIAFFDTLAYSYNKKDYYKKILASGEGDRCNPKNFAARLTEPEIAPQERKLVLYSPTQFAHGERNGLRKSQLP